METPHFSWMCPNQFGLTRVNLYPMMLQILMREIGSDLASDAVSTPLDLEDV